MIHAERCKPPWMLSLSVTLITGGATSFHSRFSLSPNRPCYFLTNFSNQLPPNITVEQWQAVSCCGTTRMTLFISFLFYLFLYLSSYFSHQEHKQGHRAYSYGTYKLQDHQLVYILHTTTTTTETSHRIRRPVRTTWPTP